MDDRAQYLSLLGACLVLTLPLELAYRARVWRRPRRLARALVPTLAIFVPWDTLAFRAGHWHLNPKYSSGVKLPGGLPVDELAFFVAVPICSLLSYEAVRNGLAGKHPWSGPSRPSGPTR
ncbi:MAG: lycopene cyclase domain-containing protein [Acidimicrobiia bacterium]|jgi:lycopene cyclase domain-containing protein|nr:lycopene cyclase domain-containing protein [Acidimicrobiia bacterium]